MSQKKLMILGAGILQLPAIKKAVDMGLRVVALDMNPDAVGFSVTGVEKEVISTIDISLAIDTAKRHSIDGVMTLATDMPMRTVAAIAKELNIVGISPETAINATDKSVMRECLLKNGVPIPKFFKVDNEKDFFSAIQNFKSPFIVKPADSSGSRGIQLVSDVKNKDKAFSAYEYSRSFSRNGTVVVEEYMSGPEVSVEAITIEGNTQIIQITDKITTGAPHFVELGHTQPSRLDINTIESIKSIAKSTISAIGINNGPSHTEIIVTDRGPKIVEIGARLGGDCITSHLVPLSTGIDIVEACIKIALGEKPDLSQKIDCGSAIRYFPQHQGTVKSINGLQEAKSVKGVMQISVVHGIGEQVTEIDSSGSRMGFIIAQGKDANDASKICEEALSKIKINIK